MVCYGSWPKPCPFSKSGCIGSHWRVGVHCLLPFHLGVLLENHEGPRRNLTLCPLSSQMPFVCAATMTGQRYYISIIGGTKSCRGWRKRLLWEVLDHIGSIRGKDSPASGLLGWWLQWYSVSGFDTGPHGSPSVCLVYSVAVEMTA